MNDIFDNVVDFFEDNWSSVFKPLVEVLFPSYAPVMNIVELLADPLQDLLFSFEDSDNTNNLNQLIEQDPVAILTDTNQITAYQTLMNRSINSSQLFLLTNEADVLAPAGTPIIPPPTGEILPEWSIENPGGILALEGDDFLIASTQTDVINGNLGNDSMAGGGGDDLIRGGKGNDAINGDIGNDIINGNRDFDQIWGSDGDDLIRGGKGNDTLNGGAGRDILIGDLGLDVLRGDQDADQFILSGINTDADVIEDFNASESDRIVVVATFETNDLSFSSFDTSNLTINLPVDIGTVQGTIIQNIETGNVLGIVANVTNTEEVKDAIAFVNPDDPVLLIG